MGNYVNMADAYSSFLRRSDSPDTLIFMVRNMHADGRWHRRVIRCSEAIGGL